VPGTLDLRLNACDTVIWLDLPTWVCLLGALERYLRYRGRTRPDVGEGCCERLSWAYLRWIWSYRRRRRPGVLEALRKLPPSKEIVVLTSRREMARWLQQVRESAA
jgi:adenylate kinase family enzyme